MKEFAVSIVLLDNSNGLFVKNVLLRILAANQDEAVGAGIRIAQQTHKGNLHTAQAIDFESEKVTNR